MVLLVELGKKFEVALSDRLSRPYSGIKTPCGLPLVDGLFCCDA
ncbi:MAG: hypothetical protein V7K40_03925 [Nostoc sp.]